jgi:hypothetical protein
LQQSGFEYRLVLGGGRRPQRNHFPGKFQRPGDVLFFFGFRLDLLAGQQPVQILRK